MCAFLGDAELRTANLQLHCTYHCWCLVVPELCFISMCFVVPICVGLSIGPSGLHTQSSVAVRANSFSGQAESCATQHQVVVASKARCGAIVLAYARNLHQAGEPEACTAPAVPSGVM